jgi:type I restriction-modification system DNA methylase subunit
MVQSKQYKCLICKTRPDQKSHHKSHLKSKKCISNSTIFRLQLEKESQEILLNRYGNENIDTIIHEQQNYEFVENDEFEFKTNENRLIWNLMDNQIEYSEEYLNAKSSLDSIVKNCHQILYSNGAIVGPKAQADIMKLLSLKILEHFFKDPENEIVKRINKFKEIDTNSLSESKINEYKGYLENLSTIALTGSPLNKWSNFIDKYVSKIIPSLFSEKDLRFNITDINGFKLLINKIYSLDITDEFINAFGNNSGDIHESFLAYSKKGSKELGQFFTPRNLIDCIFYGLNLKDVIQQNYSNPKIYDPCMGTAGFLTRLYKIAELENSDNIYGVEWEADTIKFAFSSIILTTQQIINRNNLKLCNSISENDLLLSDTKMDIIVTNPPFGTTMNYKELKHKFETLFNLEGTSKFSEIYPIVVNNGACLFIQHCVYMLAPGGLCAIVLPDGELFEGNSKWSINFRKWLYKNVNIKKIMKAPSGVFAHADVETNILVFTKDPVPADHEITFLNTNKKCDQINYMFKINTSDFEKRNFSLDIGEYLPFNFNESNVETIQIKNLFDLEKGKIQKSKAKINDDSEIKFVTGAKYSNWLNIENNEIELNSGENLFINNSAYGNSIQVRYYNGNSIHCNLMTKLQLKSDYQSRILIKLYYHFLKQKKEFLELNCQKGASNKSLNIEKFKILELPLLELEKQEEILQELNYLEESISNTESLIMNIKKQKNLFRKYSMSNEINNLLLDSEKLILDELLELIKGNLQSTQVKSLEDGKYYFINKGEKSNWQKINLDQCTASGKNIFIANASNGNGSIPIRYHDGNCDFSNLLYRIKFKDQYVDNINVKFYYYLLKERKEFLEEKCQKGSSNKSININRFKRLELPLPSLEIQEQCLTIFEEKEKYLAELDEKIKVEQDYILKLNELSKDLVKFHCNQLNNLDQNEESEINLELLNN